MAHSFFFGIGSKTQAGCRLQWKIVFLQIAFLQKGGGEGQLQCARADSVRESLHAHDHERHQSRREEVQEESQNSDCATSLVEADRPLRECGLEREVILFSF